MSKRLGGLAIVLALLAVPAAAFAASPWASEATTADKIKGKFVYGLKNTALGWTELLTEPYEAATGGGNFFVGLGKGVWNAVGQTAGGALHLGTFFIPQIDVPLPEGGTKLLS